MRTPSIRTAVPAVSIAVVLAVAGCGDGSDESTPDAPATQEPTDPGDDGSTTDPTTDPTTGETPTDDDATASGDITQAGLRAIATAEAEVGGTAFAIDDEDDDQTWEVDVAAGDRQVEVEVSADGTQVTGTDDDDLDDDDRAGLQQAQIGIGDAIQTAVAEVDGTLDDAELTEDDGQFAWEVSVDTSDDDIEVHVDITTGDVLTVDRDD